ATPGARPASRQRCRRAIQKAFHASGGYYTAHKYRSGRQSVCFAVSGTRSGAQVLQPSQPVSPESSLKYLQTTADLYLLWLDLSFKRQPMSKLAPTGTGKRQPWMTIAVIGTVAVCAGIALPQMLPADSTVTQAAV